MATPRPSQRTAKRQKKYPNLVPDWRERYRAARKRDKPYLAFWLTIAGVSDKELKALDGQRQTPRGSR